MDASLAADEEAEAEEDDAADDSTSDKEVEPALVSSSSLEAALIFSYCPRLI